MGKKDKNFVWKKNIYNLLWIYISISKAKNKINK